MAGFRRVGGYVAGTVVLLAVGCSPSGDSEIVRESASRTTDDLSPLEEYLGAGAVSVDGGYSVSLKREPVADLGGFPSEDELSQRAEFEETVAACMTDSGFEYFAFVPSDMGPWQRIHDIYALPKVEFVAEYGYGISTLPEARDQVRRAAGEDPNVAIREAMADAERAAYADALFGDGDGSPSSAEGGCHGQAMEVLYGDERPDVLWSALSEELSDLSLVIEGDRRVQDVVGLWSRCMAEAGFPDVSRLDQTQPAVYNRLDQLPGSTEARVPFEDVDPDDLREIQDFERALAAADYDCRHESRYDEVFADVQLEHEGEFVEQHREQLEPLREWLSKR